MIAPGEANFKGLGAMNIHYGRQLPHLTSRAYTEIPRLGPIEDPPWSMIRLKSLRIIRRCLLARS